VRKALFLVQCLWIAAAAAALAGAQTPKKDDDEVIKVDTQLVDVPVVVTDRTGKPVLNLKSGNFAVFEDNKPQEVTEFSATTAPFEVALLLDTSGSTRSELDLIRRSAQSFIDSLRPGDRVSIVAFDTSKVNEKSEAMPVVLTGLTSDRQKLRDALTRIGTSNGTPYYDALIKIAQTVFKDPPRDEFRGRRALVALTDGVDSTSASEFGEVQELLRKAGLLCFFIKVDTRPYFEEGLLGDCSMGDRTHLSQSQLRRYYRSYYPKGNVEKVSSFCQLGDFERLAISKGLYELADSQMTALSKASAGRVFTVDDLSGSQAAFKSVADEIGTKYSLGYYSSNEKRDGTYRKIRVELKGLPAGSQVRAREGYTAPSN
jgi:VWFA-related protein